MTNPNSILRLKVTLKGIDPPIWRRLEIPPDFTLARLHRALQVAMGWTDRHLHQFLAGEDRYGPLDSEMQEDRRDEGATCVGDYSDRPGIALATSMILATGGSMRSCSCVDGERACPPEDCGGIPGYLNFLQAVRDMSHPEPS